MAVIMQLHVCEKIEVLNSRSQTGSDSVQVPFSLHSLVLVSVDKMYPSKQEYSAVELTNVLSSL